MNRIHPKGLLQSKWTKVAVQNKEKHFVITDVEFDENQKVIHCVIEAVINHHQYPLDWHELKDATLWRVGWK
ncbi:TIGR02450 family Trp-rich protein [Photobacterium sanctipauli]|uniref:TIGR02450 family Trp-rich protein n=1 Tax=Photobacterium sanctipauli TaxID=1342794 RepID=A0A2T3P0I7_9GAMM|nr:TIGR02450 family Trp-rich protein [Photobacterium sanctipauli]PSW21988.1 TIGR02450 family Trp-rich protein [Photobacterium sanctipauli]